MRIFIPLTSNVCATESCVTVTVSLLLQPLIENAGAGAVGRFSALIAADRTAALERIPAAFAAEWGPRGYALELSGPWPAYRFATLEAAGR